MMRTYDSMTTTAGGPVASSQTAERGYRVGARLGSRAAMGAPGLRFGLGSPIWRPIPQADFRGS